MTNKHLLSTVATALGIFVVLFFISQAIFPALLSPQHVILKSKPWNDGYVHVWHDIVELSGPPGDFTNVADGTRCERLDNQTHKLIGPPPPILYYHVNCDGVIGYVEIDQVR